MLGCLTAARHRVVSFAGSLLPAAVLTLAVSAPAPASACSPRPPGPCSPAYVGLAGGSVLPANFPGFLFRPTFVVGTQLEPPGASDLFVLGPSDQRVPVDVEGLPGGFLVRPRSPLVPGEEYRIRYRESCADHDAPPGLMELVFRAGPVAPLPTSLGELELGGQSVQRVSVRDAGRCLTTIDAVVSTVFLQPSPELVPYLPLAHLTAEGSGQSWQSEKNPGDLCGSQPIVFNPHANCSGDRLPTTDNGLPLGNNKLVLKLSIPGVTGDLAGMEVEVDMSCDHPQAEAEPTVNVCPSSEPRRVDEGFGCSVPPGGSPAGGLGVLVAIAAAAGLIRLRRRGR